jgi:hypothetical protein
LEVFGVDVCQQLAKIESAHSNRLDDDAAAWLKA